MKFHGFEGHGDESIDLDVYDIRDRKIVESPAYEGPREGFLDSDIGIAAELDRYKRSILYMPREARNRFMRFAATHDAIMRIIGHGREHGLTTS
jgi:hypothetical protein